MLYFGLLLSTLVSGQNECADEIEILLDVQ